MASDNGTPIRVLIADDTPDIRLLLRAALRIYPGFEIVAEAADGSEPPDEMLSYITHELSSPLAVIRGFAEILSKEVHRLSQQDAMESVNAILRGSKQMQALLDNFSDARRVDTDAVDLVREEIDVGEMISQTAQDMRAVLAPHVVLVDAPKDLTVKLEPVRIRQILTNLLSNAAKV